MREILFKAKRLSDGEWVEGFPYWGEYSGAFILQNKACRLRNARTGEIAMRDDVVPIEVDPPRSASTPTSTHGGKRGRHPKYTKFLLATTSENGERMRMVTSVFASSVS